MHAKFRAHMYNSKRVMIDRWNSKWRPPPSWISYFCPFWSNGLFPVAAVYITAKWHSSTSIGGWSYWCLCKNPRWRNFVMLDHPRSSFVHLKLPFKFRVDWVRTFRDIAIRKFRKFGLKCLFRPPKVMFLGEFWPPNVIFYHQDPQTRILSHKRLWSVFLCDL